MYDPPTMTVGSNRSGGRLAVGQRALYSSARIFLAVELLAFCCRRLNVKAADS